LSGGDVIAFYAKAKKQEKLEKPKDKCSHCKKWGHKKLECRKLKKEQEEAKAKANPTATTAASTSKPSTSNQAVTHGLLVRF